MLVSLITSQYYRVLYGGRIRAIDKGRWLKGAIKLKDVHGLLCRTVGVFREWPNSFFAFLLWRSRHLRSKARVAGVQRDFGELWTMLQYSLKSPAFNFVRDAFDNYLKMFWDGGHASRIKRLQGKQTRYVSKQQARKILRATGETVDRLIGSSLGCFGWI